MGKFAEIETSLMQRVTAAVAACYEEGSPVAGQTSDKWGRIAHIAIRRFRSFSRRNVPTDDYQAQIRDVARGFIEAFSDDPKLVGPLVTDYEYVAGKILEIIRSHQHEGGG